MNNATTAAATDAEVIANVRRLRAKAHSYRRNVNEGGDGYEPSTDDLMAWVDEAILRKLETR